MQTNTPTPTNSPAAPQAPAIPPVPAPTQSTTSSSTQPATGTSAPAQAATPIQSPVAQAPQSAPSTPASPVVPNLPGIDSQPTPILTQSSDQSSSDSPSAENSAEQSQAKDEQAKQNSIAIMQEAASRINDAHNILIALSSDPSVDELATAIGLSLCLDRAGKRATAIYSGRTPNALEFLKPEETFEHSADTLQDFVIALNKDKADHLRYKLDGDFVRIFITPYKSRISEDDLEFTYGDFNIDLVLALDVANGVDLDDALREHGRIMHDATIINITTGNPGKFGELEWSDKSASSVAEMVSRLLFSMSNKLSLEPEDATALLTGIVAATNRFSKASTTAETMEIASKLMLAGANQQLITENITSDLDNQLYTILDSDRPLSAKNDPTSLTIDHDEDDDSASKSSKPRLGSLDLPADSTRSSEDSKAADSSDEPSEVSGLMDDLKAAAESLSQASAKVTPEPGNTPVDLSNLSDAASPSPVASSASPSSSSTEQPTTTTPSGGVSITPSAEFLSATKPETVVAPSAGFNADAVSTNKYGKMLEEALSGTDAPVSGPILSQPDPVAPATPAPVASVSSQPATPPAPAPNQPASSTPNPAASIAPTVPVNPEINGVPEINYGPLPGDQVLPPPPTPPIDLDSASPLPPAPTTPPSSATSSAPAASTPSSDPSAFKIPGM